MEADAGGYGFAADDFGDLFVAEAFEAGHDEDFPLGRGQEAERFVEEGGFLFVFERDAAGGGGVEAFFPFGLEAFFAPVIHLKVTDDGVDPGLEAVAVFVAALEADHAAEGFLDEVFAELAVLIHAPAVAEELFAVAIEEGGHGGEVAFTDAGHEGLVGVWYGAGMGLQQQFGLSLQSRYGWRGEVLLDQFKDLTRCGEAVVDAFEIGEPDEGEVMVWAEVEDSAGALLAAGVVDFAVAFWGLGEAPAEAVAGDFSGFELA